MAFAIRLHNLESDSLWFDELYTTRVASMGWEAFTADHTHPGLYYLTTAVFYGYFNQTEFAARLSSLFWGILAIPLTIQAGRTLGLTVTGIIAALLLALSPFHLRYSQEARMYTQLMAFSLLSFIFLYRSINWSDRQVATLNLEKLTGSDAPGNTFVHTKELSRNLGWKYWLAFSVVTVLNLYTHYGALIVLAAQTIFIVFWALRQWLKGNRKHLFWPILAALGVVAAYLPWLPHFIDALKFNVGAETITDTGTRAPIVSWIEIMIRDFGMMDNGMAILFLILCSAGLVLLAVNRRWFDLSWILTGLILPIGLIYIFQVARGAFSRYIIYILPFYLLPIAYVVDQTLLILNRRLGKGAYVLGTAVLGLAFVWPSLAGVEKEYNHIAEDWRGILSYLDAQASGGDVILTATMNLPSNVVGTVFSETLELSQETYHLVIGNAVTLSDAVMLKEKDNDVWAVIKQWGRPITFDVPSVDITPFQTDLYVVHDREGDGNALEETLTMYERLLDFASSPEPRCSLQRDLSVLYFADGDFDNAERLQAEAVALCPGQEIDSQMLLAANISEARLVEQLKAVASEGDVVIGLGATLSDTVKLAASAVPSFISDDNHDFVYLRGDKLNLDELVDLAPQERNLWAALWYEGDPNILEQAGLLLFDVGNSLYLVRVQDATGTITQQLVALRETLAEQGIPVATLCMLDQQITYAHAKTEQFGEFVEKLDQLISGCVDARPTTPVLGLIGRETNLALRQIFTHLLEEGDLESASKVAVRLLTFENSQQDVPDLPEFVQPLIDGRIDKARRLAYDLLVIDAKNPDALGLLTAVDLMERFEQANAVTYTQDAPEPVNIRRFVMPHNGDWGNVIFTHPPVALSFALNLPEEPVALQTRVALDPQSWGWGGDGVTFIVTIQEDGGLPVELYRTHVTNDDSGHDWRPVLVSLAGYAGKEVVLTLAAASGPSGDSTGDWAGWESPRLIWELMD